MKRCRMQGYRYCTINRQTYSKKNRQAANWAGEVKSTELKMQSSTGSLPFSTSPAERDETDVVTAARRGRALRRLTMEKFWELLTTRQPSPEEVEVVGAVVQVVGRGPVHSQRGKTHQCQLSEFIWGLWGKRGRSRRGEKETAQWRGRRRDRSDGSCTAQKAQLHRALSL